MANVTINDRVDIGKTTPADENELALLDHPSLFMSKFMRERFFIETA